MQASVSCISLLTRAEPVEQTRLPSLAGASRLVAALWDVKSPSRSQHATSVAC